MGWVIAAGTFPFGMTCSGGEGSSAFTFAVASAASFAAIRPYAPSSYQGTSSQYST
ncbi:MAG: hypothetical protein HYZ28_10875 [Myxococcales bacterium]|nr:hypothetical protein [Myxococcales bacterium]